MSRCIRFLNLLFLLLISAQTYAHTGSIQGTVKDTKNNVIAGANVLIPELNIVTETDAFGKYFIKGLEEKSYTIVIKLVGYKQIVEEIVIEEGITTTPIHHIESSNVKMDDVVITSQKAAATSPISEFDIKLRPVNNSQEVLRAVPGLFIAQHQGGGKAEQIFLRGFDVDHGTDVNIQVDGMPVNMVSHAHGQGYADLHFVIPELIDKVEFGKGTYQADKGNFTTAGWVEYKTKNYLDNSFTKLEIGNYGYNRILTGLNILNNTDGKQTAYIAAEYLFNRGYFDAPQNFNRINLTGKYTNQLSDNKLLKVTLMGFRSNWDASGQVPERAVENDVITRYGEIDKEFGATSRYNLNAELLQTINYHSYFKSQVYASYYDFELFSNFTFFLNDPVNGDQIKQRESRVITGYKGDYINEHNLLGMSAETKAGIGIRYDHVLDNELSRTADRKVLLNRMAFGDINETNMYGYVNERVELVRNLVLNAGVRFDYFIHQYTDKLGAEVNNVSDATAAIVSPKASLQYNFNNKGSLYFKYGTGFHSNDTRVVTQRNGVDILPKAHSYDLGLTLKPYSKLLLNTAVWRLDLEQEFVYVGDESVIELSGPTRRMGVDFSARYQILSWLFADADVNYTYARSIEEPEGQNYIPLAPDFTSTGGISTVFENGFSASFRYRHLRDRAANEDYSLTAEGYTIFDLAANYTVKKYEFGVQVQNLFNTQWREAQFETETLLRNEVAPVSDICFTPGTPFFIKGSVTYRF